MTTNIHAFTASASLALLIAPIRGEIIFSETFSDGSMETPSALDGSTPDVTTDGATWAASEWAEDGSTGTIGIGGGGGSANDDSAFLAFTPTAGNIYTLAATMTVPTDGGTTGWVALGFAETATMTGSFWSNNTAPWLLWRPAGASSPEQVVTFQGPGTAGSDGEGAYTGPQTFRIVLDTTGANWTAEWFVGESSVRVETYPTNPAINFVGFGRENGQNTAIDNFSLEDASGANALRLSGFTYDPVTGACSVDLKGIPGASYKLVEAADLEFGNPDQSPVPLTSVTVGTPEGTPPAATAVVTDPNGDATVEFNLGTGKDLNFIRAEQTSP